MWYRPDEYRQWRIECTRGTSSVVVDVWVFAPSHNAAVDKVRQSGYQPAAPRRV